MQCIGNTAQVQPQPQGQGQHDSKMENDPLGTSKEHKSPPILPLPVMSYDGPQYNYFYCHQQPPFVQQQEQFVDPLCANGQGNPYANPPYHQFAQYYYHQTHTMTMHQAPPMAHSQPIMDPSYYPGGPHPGGPPLPSQAHPAFGRLDSHGSQPGRGPLSSGSSHSSADSSSARHRRDRRRRGRGDDRQNSGAPRSTAPVSPNRGRYDDMTLYQIQGRVVEIVKERGGSRFVQRRLQAADADEIQIVFEEVTCEIEDLWNHVYGNYILQGVLDFGTEEMRDAIGRKMLDSGIVALSTKLYGCRLVQKALDTFKKDDVANLVTSMKGKVCLLVRDRNGNHVIQKSVTTINKFLKQSKNPEEDELLRSSLETIVAEVMDNIRDLSVHCFGCRLVQRLIECCTGDQKDRVLDGVVRDDLCGTLINDDYGNYVVQCLLLNGRPSDRAAVFHAISGRNVLKLSKQKHSSNVLEKMLAHGDDVQRNAIIEEIINSYCVDLNCVKKSAVVSMAEDAYANYVLQTALDILKEGPIRERLLQMLLPCLPELEESRYAKQVILRVKESRRVS